jgi:P pilus assembly chaperone PapD
MSESSQSEKILEVENDEEFYMNTGRPIRTVKRQMWKTSGDYILPSARTSIAGGGVPTS